MAMSDYRWSEEDVAQHLGVTRRELKRMRHEQLMPVEHYEIVEGKHRFAEAGLLALCAFVKVDPPPGMDPAKKTAPAQDGVDGVMAFLVERMCPNPIWVLGRLLDENGPVGVAKEKCRVRSNLYLRFRQKISVVRNGDHFREVRVRA